MNKHESKYFNTASLFDETLIILLEKKDIDYITVKELCEIAGVNRSTFYLHYESINDLLNETLEYVINKFINYFNKDSKNFIEKINSSDKNNLILIKEEYLKPYLKFTKDNKKVFIAALKNPTTLRVQEYYFNLEKYIFYPILDKFDIPDNEKKYVLQFYINGIIGIIKQWIINNCEDEIDDIMNIIIMCVRP